MWNLIYGTDEPAYKTETDSQTQNRPVVAKGGGVGEGRTGSLRLADVNYYI